MPFPLENMEEEIAKVYSDVDTLRMKIEVVRRNDIFKDNEIRDERLQKMQFKLATMKDLLKALVSDLDTFYL